MKTLKFLAIAAVCVVSSGFLSCSSDDDEPEQTQTPAPKPDDESKALALTFNGTTTTLFQMGGEAQSYQTKITRWKFEFDKALTKCTVIILDGKFASPMPPVTLRLSNLPYNKETSEITGADIVADMYEVGGWTPTPRYTFGTFKAHIDSSNPESVNVEFTVTGVGSGTFESSGVLEE